MGKVKHTEFYDLLNVAPDATPAQLKKAYYKAALRLHPDKGGDPKVFQEMKDAYDVLSDPQKRKIYDRYGPLMLKVMSGNASPEESYKILGFLRKREKLAILSVFSLITMFLLLFPILLSLRWNDATALTWAEAFIPLWILQFLATVVFYFAVQGPKTPEQLDPEEKEAFTEVMREIRALQIWFGTTMVLLVLLEILIVLRLQDVIMVSWYIVLLPLIVLQVFYIAYSIRKAPSQWRSENVVQEKDMRYLKEQEFWLYLFNETKWRLLILLTLLLVAAVADGTLQTSYFVAIIPLLIGACAKILWAALHPGEGEEQERDPETGGVPEKKNPRCTIPLAQILCITGPWLVMVCLAAAKLDDMQAFSAFIIFIPVFVVMGCLCCTLSCLVLCLSPELFEQMEAAEKEAREKENATNAARHQQEATEKDNLSGNATGASQTAGATPIFYGTIPTASQPGAQTTTTTTTTARIEVTTTTVNEAAVKQSEADTQSKAKETVHSSQGQGNTQTMDSTNTEKMPADTATVQTT